jgi:putative heme iron utilization protein
MADDAEQLAAPVQPRQLMRRADRAVLATTLTGQPLPWPYASLVLVAFDHDGAPLLLLSDLAEHTKNIVADARVSLLIDGTAGHAVPLAGPRLTLLGLATRSDDKRLHRRFLARHSSAELYANFPDFHLYRVAVERGHLVGGFGKIRWIEAGELRVAVDAAAFAELAATVIEAVNRDHAPAADALAHKATGTVDLGWELTDLDPDGVELRREGVIVRYDFPEPQLGPAALLEALGIERRE